LNLLTAFSVPLFFGDVLLWSPRNIPTELMIGGLYFAVGIVMILVARNPLSHKAFVDFVVISNILHAIVMLVYATNVLQVVLDVGFVGSMGVLPLLFYPWGLKKFLQY
jgi:hypothetical protein